MFGKMIVLAELQVSGFRSEGLILLRFYLAFKMEQ